MSLVIPRSQTGVAVGVFVAVGVDVFTGVAV
jgi:hypothetical protein